MSLNYTSDNAVVADLRFEHLSIQAGVGHYLLAFSIRFDTAIHTTGVYSLSHLQAKVQVHAPGGPAAMLGRADVDSTTAIRADQFRHSPGLVFELQLTPQQLQALEEIRDGGDLHFRLRISGQVQKTGLEPMPAHDQVEARIGQSAWIKELNSCGFSTTLLLEVPLAPVGAGKLAEQLAQARQMYLTGHYDQVVAQCRKVLEAVDDANPASTAKVDQLFHSSRSKMSVDERLQLLRDVTKHYTHPAHHGDQKSLDARYTRGDARMILTIAAALAAHAISEAVA